MDKLIMILLFSLIITVTGITLFVLSAKPVDMSDSIARMINVSYIDTAALEEEAVFNNHFFPLLSSPEEVISSMLQEDKDATSVIYTGYFKVRSTDYAFLEQNGRAAEVKVGDFLFPYRVYGITEFAVLLNDTRDNSFVVAKYFKNK